jgi:hypothetical protein
VDDIKETIEQRRDEMTAGPNEPQFDRMEQAAREAKKQEEKNPEWTQGETIPVQDIQASERLQRPVATETDSY